MALLKNLGYILVCSANANEVHMLRGLLLGNGYKVQTCSSFPALTAQIKRQIPRVIIFDNVLTIPEVVELCALRDSDPYIATMQVVGWVSILDFEYENAIFENGVDNVITRPMNSLQVIRRIDNSFERSIYLEEQEGFEHLLFALTSAHDAREVCNAGHSERVARTSRNLGRRLALSEEEQTLLYKGGMLHDIGMVNIPRAILDKHGALDANEYETVKMHTILGERLCSRVRSLQKILPLVRHHHEHMDGSGYPDGLHDRQIPELARIIAICEVYDALSSDRPHRPRLSHEKALECLKDYADRQWLDAEFVNEFIAMLMENNPIVNANPETPTP